MCLEFAWQTDLAGREPGVLSREGGLNQFAQLAIGGYLFKYATIKPPLRSVGSLSYFWEAHRPKTRGRGRTVKKSLKSSLEDTQLNNGPKAFALALPK